MRTAVYLLQTPTMNRVVITGLGVVAPNGTDIHPLQMPFSRVLAAFISSRNLKIMRWVAV